MGLKNITRGDVVLVNLDPVIGSEQGKTRPALILQNDTGNIYSNTTIIAPITSNTEIKQYPTNVFLEKSILPKDSIILLSQIRTIDKRRIIKSYGKISTFNMSKVNEAIKISLALE